MPAGTWFKDPDDEWQRLEAWRRAQDEPGSRPPPPGRASARLPIHSCSPSDGAADQLVRSGHPNYYGPIPVENHEVSVSPDRHAPGADHPELHLHATRGSTNTSRDSTGDKALKQEQTLPGIIKNRRGTL